MRYPLLPKWCLTNKLPAFYDIESANAIEQTAKLYGAMQGMISDYNKFADDFNKTFEEYTSGLNTDHECFQNSITKIVHDYIAMLDEKLKMQDKEIQENITYISQNIQEGIKEIINQMTESGEIENAIVDAFDNLSARVIMLENSVKTFEELPEKVQSLENLPERVQSLENSNADNFNNLNGRLETLENSKVKLIYNSETESLDFENVEVQ